MPPLIAMCLSKTSIVECKSLATQFPPLLSWHGQYIKHVKMRSFCHLLIVVHVPAPLPSAASVARWTQRHTSFESFLSVRFRRASRKFKSLDMRFACAHPGLIFSDRLRSAWAFFDFPGRSEKAAARRIRAFSSVVLPVAGEEVGPPQPSVRNEAEVRASVQPNTAARRYSAGLCMARLPATSISARRRRQRERFRRIRSCKLGLLSLPLSEERHSNTSFSRTVPSSSSLSAASKERYVTSIEHLPPMPSSSSIQSTSATTALPLRFRTMAEPMLRTEVSERASS
mmetsp:Transcript_14504/g.42497  ORF Transcript_14504/g.42497 Transcript_14504/m.42497 type:complete len:285 (-) Transcript_14504:647-1501(-)